MSNTERQRRFRASHPGYFRKYKAAGRAARKATLNQETANSIAASPASVSIPPDGMIDLQSVQFDLSPL